MKTNSFAIILAMITSALSTSASAFEWNVNSADANKYFDKNEAYNEYFFSEEMDVPRYEEFSFYKAELNEEVDGVKYNIPCFRVTEIADEPGLFNGNGTVNSYYINFSMLKKFESGGVKRKGSEEYAIEYVTLNNGKQFKTVSFNDKTLKACGVRPDGVVMVKPLKGLMKFSRFGSKHSEHCSIDESKITNWPLASLDGVFNFRKFDSAEMSLGFNFSRAMNWKREYSHDQSGIRKEVNTCEESSRKIYELEKKRTAEYKLREIEWQKQNEEGDRRRAEDAKKMEKAIATEAAMLRKNIKIGMTTNCGPVFDVRLPMVGVQTMMGMQYINVNQLWGPSVGCYFRNGIYVGPNP